ncbi:hypothetical protein AK812_SmicGene38888, partial [Symbiodinium microadriaticum]
MWAVECRVERLEPFLSISAQRDVTALLEVLAAWRIHSRVEGKTRHHRVRVDAKRQQLQGVQTMFRSFATQLEYQLTQSQPSQKEGRLYKSRSVELGLSDTPYRPVPGRRPGRLAVVCKLKPSLRAPEKGVQGVSPKNKDLNRVAAMMDDAPDAARAPFMLEDAPAARAWRFPRLNLRQVALLVLVLLLGFWLGAALSPTRATTRAPPASQ